MNPKKIEQKALQIGMIMNLLIGIAGLTVYYLTRIEALFIGAYYTIIALLSGLVAIFISKMSHRTSLTFPNGYFILEPLYALLKSILSLILLTISTVSVARKAYLYFAQGTGEMMEVGPVIPYTILMVIIGLTLSFFFRRQNQKINYTITILLSEAKTTLMDGIISGGVGVAAMLIWMIDKNSPLVFLKYTGDFFITIILVALTIKEPFLVIRKAIVEIMGGVLKDGTLKSKIESCVRSYLAQEKFIKQCNVYKTGMFWHIQVKLE